jgi:prepilin-type N-terminal cleavage/methylation domain-containing protein
MALRIKRDGGFTFLELMITVVIVGIVAAMAVPRFGTTVDRLKMKTSVRRITSELRLARSMAIADKDQYGLYFDNSSKTITLFRDQLNPTQFKFETGDPVVKIDSMPAEITWLATDLGNDVITFRSNGSAGFTGGGNIWALGSTDNAICISTTNVLASTGRVQTNSTIY